MEHILCAANHYDDNIKHIHQPINISTGFVVAGQRHHNCIYTFSLIMKDVSRKDTVKLMNAEIQGFLTSNNRFVDRKEGMKIALDAHQLEGRTIHNIKNLHSEDLY